MITEDSHSKISLKKCKNCSIPSIGLGTYELQGKAGREGVADAIELGYRSIDTAQEYGNEKEVGQGIRDSGIDRKEIFLTDKIWFDKLEPKLLIESFAKSLDKLRTDYVDLLLVHWPSPNCDIWMDALQAVQNLKREGLVKCIGVSNFTTEQLKIALSANADIVCDQVEYHPFLSQDEIRALAVLYDFYLIAYSPIARGAVFNNTLIKGIGEKYNKNAAQVTLRWLIQQKNVVAIPRSSSHEHRKSNIDIFDFELAKNEMKDISFLARNERLVDPNFAPNW